MKISRMDVAINTAIRSTGGWYESQPLTAPRSYFKIVTNIIYLHRKKLRPSDALPECNDLHESKLLPFPKEKDEDSVQRTEIALLVDKLVDMPESESARLGIREEADAYDILAERILGEF